MIDKYLILSLQKNQNLISFSFCDVIAHNFSGICVDTSLNAYLSSVLVRYEQWQTMNTFDFSS